MARILSRLECDPKCGFIVQSEDKEELIDIVKRHAKVIHNSEFSREDVLKLVKTVTL